MVEYEDVHTGGEQKVILGGLEEPQPTQLVKVPYQVHEAPENSIYL